MFNTGESSQFRSIKREIKILKTRTSADSTSILYHISYTQKNDPTVPTTVKSLKSVEETAATKKNMNLPSPSLDSDFNFNIFVTTN